MPQLIGAAVLTAVGAGAAAGTVIAGTTLATIVGSVVLTGALVGAQLLLAPKPDIPKPADGKIQVKQAIPPPIYGYGESRSGGALAASELAGSTSYDVIAIHQGRIDSFQRYYLHDDLISFSAGTEGIVAGLPGARYAGETSRDVRIYSRKGLSTEVAYPQMVQAFPDKWSTAHRGDGIASALVIASSPEAKVFGNRFPFGLPKLSVVGRWRWVWDFRDEDQDPDDPDTWSWSENPVLHLLHFYCHCPAGYGRPVAAVYQPYAGFWIAAADRCDEDVPLLRGGTEKRYVSGGTYNSETPRKGVVEALLRTFDGWLCEVGEGGVIVYAGAYYAPDLVITDAHVIDDDIRQGYLEDERINELVVKVTSREHDFNEVEADPWSLTEEIDAGAIIVRAESKAEWCPQWRQSRRLAKIEMDRKRAKLRGTLTLNLFGENLRGRRYFMLNLRDRMSTRMVPCEVVDLEDNSFESGTFRCEFRSVDPARYDWNVYEEGAPPPITDNSEAEDMPVPNLPTLTVVRETISGILTTRIAATNPPVEGWPELGLTGWYRRVGETAWKQMQTPESGVLRVLSDLVVDSSYEVQTAYTGSKGGEGDRSPIATVAVVSDTVAPGTPITPTAVLSGSTVNLSVKSARNDDHFYSIEARRWPLGGPYDATAGVVIDGTPQVKPVNTPAYWDDTPSLGVYRYGFRAFNKSAVPSAAFAIATPDVTISGQIGADDFNRANGPVGGAFLSSVSAGTPDAQIVSNRVSATSGSASNRKVFYRDSGAIRHYAEATYQITASGASFPVAVRIIDANNFLAARWSSGNWGVFKYVAGVPTTLFSFAQAATPPVGTIVRLEVDETGLVTLKINGAVTGTPTSLGSDLAGATKAGFVIRSAEGALLDDWKFGVQ